MVPGLSPSPVSVSTSRPQGVTLPQLKDRQALFGKWSTPMAKAGFLWLALDRDTSKGPYDRLYIDSNENGRLDDETAIKAFRAEPSYARFGPVKVVLQGEDGPVSFHLELTIYTSGGSAYCYVSAAGWYEGDVSIDGVKTRLMLLDHNANGVFNDRSVDPGKADRILIGDRETAGEPMTVGRFVDVNGILYELEVAKDGAYVKLKKAQDVQGAPVRVPAGISRVTVSGTNGSFRLKPQDQGARLPVGRYALVEWAIDRKDDKGRPWTAQARFSDFVERAAFDVVEGSGVALDIGEPLVSRLTVRSSAETHSFQQELLGRLGESITLSQGGNERPGPPRVRIRDKDGAYDRTLSFAYG
jgi:hypothetical protein